MVNQIIHVIVPVVFMENIVSKLIIVPAVLVKILESVAIISRASHVFAKIIILDHNAKFTISALLKLVAGTESVCCKTMGTLVTVPRDTVARIAKPLIIVLASFVAIMGRA